MKPSSIGVENCWSCWLSSERRVCVGVERGELLEHGEQTCARSGAPAHAGEVAAQEQELRRLARLVGVLPRPSALAVAGAEGLRHRFAQRPRIERLAAFQGGEQGVGGAQEAGRWPLAIGDRLGGTGGGRGLGGRRQDEAHGGLMGLEGGKPGRAPALARLRLRRLLPSPPLPLSPPRNDKGPGVCTPGPRCSMGVLKGGLGAAAQGLWGTEPV